MITKAIRIIGVISKAKLAAAIDSTPPYINRLVKKSDTVVNKTFVRMINAGIKKEGTLIWLNR